LKLAYIIILLAVSSCCPLSMRFSDTYHTVRPGETLEEISVQYYGSRLQMRLIMEANYLKEKGKRLKAGQRLKIPREGER
jgi:nucleoid-associated protein YgaU